MSLFPCLQQALRLDVTPGNRLPAVHPTPRQCMQQCGLWLGLLSLLAGDRCAVDLLLLCMCKTSKVRGGRLLRDLLLAV